MAGSIVAALASGRRAVEHVGNLCKELGITTCPAADIQTIWLIVLSAAKPIAGVIGFAVQLRQVQKVKLENEKLQLEILAMKRDYLDKNRRIVAATTEEVVKYALRGDTMFSRGPNPGPEGEIYAPTNQWRDRAVTLFVGTTLILSVGYLIFDVFRFVK